MGFSGVFGVFVLGVFFALFFIIYRYDERRDFLTLRELWGEIIG
jgi:hypothetical protein